MAFACPKCGTNTRVTDSGKVGTRKLSPPWAHWSIEVLGYPPIRRRRVCDSCGSAWFTVEIDERDFVDFMDVWDHEGSPLKELWVHRILYDKRYRNDERYNHARRARRQEGEE